MRSTALFLRNFPSSSEVNGAYWLEESMDSGCRLPLYLISISINPSYCYPVEVTQHLFISNYLYDTDNISLKLLPRLNEFVMEAHVIWYIVKSSNCVATVLVSCINQCIVEQFHLHSWQLLEQVRITVIKKSSLSVLLLVRNNILHC